jgi:hypothetical protein
MCRNDTRPSRGHRKALGDIFEKRFSQKDMQRWIMSFWTRIFSKVVVFMRERKWEWRREMRKRKGITGNPLRFSVMWRTGRGREADITTAKLTFGQNSLPERHDTSCGRILEDWFSKKVMTLIQTERSEAQRLYTRPPAPAFAPRPQISAKYHMAINSIIYNETIFNACSDQCTKEQT